MASHVTAELLDKEIRRTVRYRYYLYLPEGYPGDPGRRWPLLLFLHGAGERGDDLLQIKSIGLPRVLGDGQELPWIVVMPQCPADTWWKTENLGVLLDEIQASHPVDLDRVSVTGMSMGGFGTWELAITYPDRFAAIAPICGGGLVPGRVRAITRVPVWAFHGAKDAVVPLRRSEEMVEALQSAGGNVRLTVYPEAGHDSWTETYANPQLYEWLGSQRRATS